MADTKISLMTPLPAAAAGDQYAVVQGGVNFVGTNTKTFALLQTTAGLVFTQAVQFGNGNSILNADGSASFSGGFIILNLNGTVSFNNDTIGTSLPATLRAGGATGGQSGVIEARNAANTTQISLDGATAALTVGNTVNGSITVKNNAGTTQMSFTAGGTPFVAIGDFVAAPGALAIGSTTGNNAVLMSGSAASRIVVRDGDIEVFDIAFGIILKSPDANRWRITVDNAGQLSVNPA